MEALAEIRQWSGRLSSCPFCHRNNETRISYDDQRPRINVKLHRRYVITTSGQLLSYLNFLNDHIRTANLHVHFNQLKTFAEEEKVYLDWSKSGGEFLEAIQHITLDAHQLKREASPNGFQRHQVRLSIDSFPFSTFTRQWTCSQCRDLRVNTWTRDDLEERCLHPFDGYRPLNKVIKACTVELVLGVAAEDFRPPSQTCLECGRLPMDVSSIMAGTSQLTRLHVGADRCICPFSCLHC